MTSERVTPEEVQEMRGLESQPGGIDIVALRLLSLINEWAGRAVGFADRWSEVDDAGVWQIESLLEGFIDAIAEFAPERFCVGCGKRLTDEEVEMPVVTQAGSGRAFCDGCPELYGQAPERETG